MIAELKIRLRIVILPVRSNEAKMGAESRSGAPCAPTQTDRFISFPSTKGAKPPLLAQQKTLRHSDNLTLNC
jgi:hypothetical protein